MSKYLNTRDLAKRLSELEDLETALSEAAEALEEHKAKERPEDDDRQDEFDEERDDLQAAYDSALSDFKDDEDELNELKAMRDEIPEWRSGQTLIRDEDFESYAMQFAEDIGALPDTSKWPADCIDWEKAAADLRQDFQSIDYQGETYWYHE